MNADFAAILELLEGSELMADIEPHALRTLALHVIAREYAAGQTIFREGEPGDWAGILVSGEVRIHKSDDERQSHTVAVETHSRSIGEMALIDGEPRSASCVAIRPSQLLVLTRAQFEKIAREHPALAFEVLMRIARLVSRRLRMTSGKLVDHLDH